MLQSNNVFKLENVYFFMAKEETVVASLVSYLERNLKKGYKIEDLRWALITQKHSRIEIEKAIKIVEARTPSAKQEMPKMERVETREAPVVIPEKRGFWSRIFG
jgi:hypothetical protein